MKCCERNKIHEKYKVVRGLASIIVLHYYIPTKIIIAMLGSLSCKNLNFKFFFKVHGKSNTT